MFLKNHTREEFKISNISKKVVVTQKNGCTANRKFCAFREGEISAGEKQSVLLVIYLKSETTGKSKN